MTEILTSAIDDITRKDTKALKYKGDETAAERIKKHKHEFFTLLTTQLKNQDPLAPMDSSQMTQQIFAINGVEQQLETNRHLEELKSHFEVAQDASYINYIGKNVTFEGNKVVLQNNTAQLNYDLAKEAAQAKVIITDKFGNEVDTLTISTKVGRGMATWNKPAHITGDDFRFKIEAYDSQDDAIAFKTYSTGTVQGLITDQGRKYFSIDGKMLPIEKIKDVMMNFAELNKPISGVPAQPASAPSLSNLLPPELLTMLQKNPA